VTLPAAAYVVPDKVQQFRWRMLTREDKNIHNKHQHARI